MTEAPTLTGLLDLIEDAAAEEDGMVSVQDVLNHIGDRSIIPVVLLISLLLVSPLSGIPGIATLFSIVILTMMVQMFMRRDHLWLPPFLRNRQLRSDRLQRSVASLRAPAAWIDRHSHPRLRILTSGPLRWLTLVLCLLVPMLFPFLELVPFTTSIGAAGVALMSFGLLTRDGLYVVGGYCVVGSMLSVIAWLLRASL